MLPTRSRHTPRRSRWSLVLAALLVLPGQVGAFLHLATTQHVVCPDHGEAAERSAACIDGDAGLHASEGADASGASDPTGSAPGSSHAPHRDHHCVALQLWSQALRSADVPVLETLADLMSTEANAPAFAVRSPRLAAWRVAPKHSPPAA